MKFRSIKNTLLAGELSGTAIGRTDLPQYPHACKLLRNMIPITASGAYRRPGTLYEASLAAASYYAPALIPFVVSRAEAYMLYITRQIGGNTIMGGFRSASNIYSSANEGVAVTVTGTLPYAPALLTNLGTVGFYDEWHSAQWAQSVDVMTLTHPRYIPQRVNRTAKDTFNCGAFDAGFSGASLRDCRPYLPQNTTAITLAPAAVTGNTTLTASSAFFDPNHVGAYFKINHAGTIGCAKVTGYTSSTVVNVTVIVNFGATTAQAAWWESAWSDYRGWPRAVGFWQGRQVYAGSDHSPDSLWFSQYNNYDVLSVAATADSRSETSVTAPFTFELSEQQLNRINWLSPDKTFLIGTDNNEWLLSQTDTAAGFGCGNVTAVMQSSYGSAYHGVIREDNELLFCRASDNEISALAFNLLQNNYQEEPTQTLFDEYPKIESGTYALGARRYRRFAWDKSRRTMWACDTAGSFFGLTRSKALNLTTWHSHQFGGFDSTKTGGAVADGGTSAVDPMYGLCAGSVSSVGVIPNPFIGMDDVWVAVKRFVNSTYVYHIERMIGGKPAYDSAYNLQVANGAGQMDGVFFVDAAVANFSVNMADYTIGAGGQVALSHLRGVVPVGTAFSTYGIFEITGSAVDVSGHTTLQPTYPPHYLDPSLFTYVVFGLANTPIIQPVRIEAGSQIGTAQGAPKRIHELTVRFYRTLSAKVGSSASKAFPINFREASLPLNKSAEIFTGDKRLKIEADYDRDGYVYITCEHPLPFAVTAIISEGMTYD